MPSNQRHPNLRWLLGSYPPRAHGTSQSKKTNTPTNLSFRHMHRALVRHTRRVCCSWLTVAFVLVPSVVHTPHDISLPPRQAAHPRAGTLGRRGGIRPTTSRLCRSHSCPSNELAARATPGQARRHLRTCSGSIKTRPWWSGGSVSGT
jgi:hypothetical protein